MCRFMFENTAAGTPDWPNPNLLYTCASVSVRRPFIPCWVLRGMSA